MRYAAIALIAVMLAGCKDAHTFRVLEGDHPSPPIEVRSVDRSGPSMKKTLRTGGYVIALGDPDSDGDAAAYVQGPRGYGELRCTSLAADGKVLKNDWTNWGGTPAQIGIHVDPSAARVDCWASKRF